MTPEESARELLALVESERDRRCAEVANRAAGEERRILGEARREALRRARAAFDALRARAALELRAVHAELETARRRVRLAADRAIVEQGLARLDQELRRRWGEPAGRSAWIAAALECAAHALLDAGWTITCAAGSEEELRRARPRAQVAGDATLEAGIRVTSGGAVMDATLGALLEDRRALEARLLGEMETK